MSPPRRLCALGLTIVMFLPALAAGDDPASDSSAGKKLLSEGDALADKGDTTEAVLRYKQAFEKLLPGMRKIPFKHEVKRDVTAREDLRAYLIKELEEDKTEAEFRGDELGMKALGFIPRQMNYKEVMLKVYSEEIAAFYDPKTKTMHLIKEPVKPAQAPGLLQRLLGKKSGFDKDENKTVIAHELTHALADQNYDLDAMQKANKGDDDRQLALSALIEGEATLTMMGAQMNDWSGTSVAKLPAADLDRTFTFLMPLMRFGSGPSLRDAPPILVESLLFPYLRGLVYCARLTNEGSWAALDAAYENPPLSTEQVLHPEKFRRNPDVPMAIDLGKLDAGSGWKEVSRNVVGEMQLAVLLKRHGGKAASEGWDGDQFAAFEGPNGKLGLVWRSTWDREEDAREFTRNYAWFQGTKIGKEAAAPDPDLEAITTSKQGAAYTVERRGSEVVVIEGFPIDSTKALLEAAFAARKTEKTAAPRGKPAAPPAAN